MIIKTREQFEKHKLELTNLDIHEDTGLDVIDTIEALGKVTRAVQTLDLMKAGMDGGSRQSIHKAEMALGDAMVEIPDWLTGANHQ